MFWGTGCSLLIFGIGSFIPMWWALYADGWCLLDRHVTFWTWLAELMRSGKDYSYFATNNLVATAALLTAAPTVGFLLYLKGIRRVGIEDAKDYAERRDGSMTDGRI